MKKIITATIVIVSFILPFCVFAVVPATTQLVTLLQKTNSFQANFTQQTYDAKNQLIQKSRGKMQFVRPGQFRWETFSPTHQIIIANNQWLWIYDVDLQQVTKQPINKAAITPARVLSGDTAKLLADFDVTHEQNGIKTQFNLMPKNKESAWQQVIIYFKGSVLQGISITNELGQKNIFSFSSSKTNIKLAPTLFQFTPPKGVDVLQS